MREYKRKKPKNKVKKKYLEVLELHLKKADELRTNDRED